MHNSVFVGYELKLPLGLKVVQILELMFSLKYLKHKKDGLGVKW